MKTKIISINNQRMSSLEIAKLCGKNHKDVMQAIRNMEPAWEKIAQGNFSLGSYRDPNNQLRPQTQWDSPTVRTVRLKNWLPTWCGHGR